MRVTAIAVDREVLEQLIAPLARLPVEMCAMMFLDAHYRLVALRHVTGTRGGVDVPVRLFVADALAFDARAAIMAHNHPSGDATASADDVAVTRHLARTFDAVGVTLIDHIVLAGRVRTSLRAGGYL